MKLNVRRLMKQFKERFYKPLFLILALIVLCGHDLYVKMDTYFIQPNSQATLSLFNGTFEISENIITRDRIIDASMIAHGKRMTIESNDWKDQDSTITQLNFKVGEAGTYVFGVSTKAKNIALTAKKFNDYLKSDGVLDMLEKRTNDSLLGQDAIESYQKHVKAIYQVGDNKTNDWSTALGYPIEFVPQANPYERYSGETLDVLLLLEGKPLVNQLVFADYIQKGQLHSSNGVVEEHEHDGNEHSHSDNNVSKAHEHDGTEHTHSHENAENNEVQSHSHSSIDEAAQIHTSGQQLHTNDQGVVSVDLPEDGIYYLRTIHMVTTPNNDEITHQSKWATLTFEVTHEHGEGTHTHDDHGHEEGVPAWVFILVSLAIVSVLFVVFRRKEK